MGTKTHPNLSLLFGPNSPDLWEDKIGDLVDKKAQECGNRAAVIFPWQNHRLSYTIMAERSRIVAKALLSVGLKHGDCVGIMSGNRYQYIETFLGAARIGCPFVVFNNTYTEKELAATVKTSSCKLVFLASNIGVKDLTPHIKTCGSAQTSPPELEHIVFLQPEHAFKCEAVNTYHYDSFTSPVHTDKFNDAQLKEAEKKVKPSDVLNLQFTSGTTGAPKAAMLTHLNLINNGFLIGVNLGLTVDDVICCPPPLFHCFGLTIGYLAALTHGCGICFPSDQFNENLVLDAIVQENCTSLYGVPTMFVAALAANKTKGYKIKTLKTGVAAGSPVSQALMRQAANEFGIEKLLIAYGMTETSPVTFMSTLKDPEMKRVKTVGRIMPHTGAKIIDKKGNIVSRGERGEVCTSGYALQPGYWRNKAKTEEAMKRDENGILWMHTGDEGIIDEEGYCAITGRIKDMIIRGGENIFPVEIEDRLVEHQSIAEASVVGLKDEKYGEVVASFLKLLADTQKPDHKEINEWVRQNLGSHKAPVHVFWVGADKNDVAEDFPKTGSGKHQKHILRDLGNKLISQDKPQSKL